MKVLPIYLFIFNRNQFLTRKFSAAPVDKQKASTKKKKSKGKAETAENLDDEKFDKLISEILEKRVSGSSTQTHPTAPVTTAVSSASMPKEGCSAAAPVVAPSEISSKKKQKPKSKKEKGTKDLQAIHTEIISEAQEADNTHILNKESNGPQPSAPHSDKRSENPRRLLQKVDDPCIKDKSLDTEMSANSAGTSQPDNSTPNVHSIPSLSKSIIGQPSRHDHLQPKPVVDQIVGIPENDTTTLSKQRVSLAPMSVLPFAPSGSSISEILIQSKDEGSSSESDSDSSEDDDSDKGTKVTTINPSQGLPSRPAPFNTGNNNVDLRTSFSVGNFDFGPNLDIEDLLKPEKHLSWRDIPMSPKNGSDDESEKLLTDLEEEDEEDNEKEKRKKPRRSSLAFRRESSSPSADEDEEEDKELIGNQEVNNIGIDGYSEGDPSAFEPSNDNAISTPEDRTKIIQANPSTTEVDADIEFPLAGSQRSPSQSPQLPFLKDVNERGESVFTEGMGDLAVNQAMEEDDTAFLASLGGLGRETYSAKVQTVDDTSAGNPHREYTANESARSQAASEVSSKNPDGDELDQLMSSSKAPSADDPASGEDEPLISSEEQASEIPITSTPRPGGEAQDSFSPNVVNSTMSTSRPTTPVRESAPEATSPPKTTGPWTPGTLRRMKDRYGKPVSPMKPLAQLSTSHNETPGSSVIHDHVLEAALEEVPVPAHPPRYVTRRSRSIISAEPSNSQVSESTGTRSSTRQRKKAESTVTAPAVAEMEAEPSGIASRLRKRSKKPELEITFPQTSQGRTRASRNTNLRTSIAESYQSENNSVNDGLPELDLPPMIETVDENADVARSLPVRKGGDEEIIPQTEDSKSASTTEVEGSISGDIKNDDDISPALVSTQLVQKESPKERATSPIVSSSSDESESDEIEQAKPKYISTHRPSLNGFHSLNAIAKRQDLFSPAGTPRPSFALSPVATFGSQTPAKGFASNVDDDDSSSSSSPSGSDSDEGEKPNIPRGRRAGSSIPKPNHSLRSYFGF